MDVGWFNVFEMDVGGFSVFEMDVGWFNVFLLTVGKFLSLWEQTEYKESAVEKDEDDEEEESWILFDSYVVSEKAEKASMLITYINYYTTHLAHSIL